MLPPQPNTNPSKFPDLPWAVQLWGKGDHVRTDASIRYMLPAHAHTDTCTLTHAHIHNQQHPRRAPGGPLPSLAPSDCTEDSRLSSAALPSWCQQDTRDPGTKPSPWRRSLHQLPTGYHTTRKDPQGSPWPGTASSPFPPRPCQRTSWGEHTVCSQAPASRGGPP